MEKQFLEINKKLKMLFYSLWGVAAVIILFGELDASFVGLYSTNALIEYYLDSGVILATLILVPLALKLYNILILKKIKQVGLEKAMSLYVRGYVMQYLMLLIPVAAGFFIYYLTLKNVGALCGLIGLGASLFCIPNIKRLKEDLDL